ncbi:MAG: S8 family serine peptidase [Rhodothermales bacterium]|nr:S8 family serine peptidase [Rhodothermales bacterium]MBO6780802.1 S8 family serine peptidase [Rhodothermales bacterium]
MRSFGLLPLVLLSCLTVAASAQTASLDIGLKRMLADPDRYLAAQQAGPERFLDAELRAGKTSHGPVHLKIRARNPALAASAVAQVGGSSALVPGTDILTAIVPLAAVRRLASTPGVVRLELARRVRPMGTAARRNDLAVASVNADQVHAGTGLSQGYDGSGVILGVIDTGIDWRHLDFTDPDDPTQSRVWAIWDQNDTQGPPPAGFSYGTLWTRSQIEAALTGGAAVRQRDEDGHGTHVAGSAAGTGAANGQHAGAAPGADIMMVATNWLDTGIVDGAKWIFDTATYLARPAAVNASLGTHAGPHDGTALMDQALDAMLAAEPGRAFLAAAGNEGASTIHWGTSALASASAYVEVFNFWDVFGYPEGIVSLTGVVPTSELQNIEVSFSADSAGSFLNPMSAARLGTTPWRSLTDVAEEVFGTLDTLRYGSGQIAGLGQIAVSRIDDRNSEIWIGISDSLWADGEDQFGDPVLFGAELWRIRVRGSGFFHLWKDDGTIITTDPGSYGATPDPDFLPGNNDYSVGSPAGGNLVIAVGASTNRAYSDDCGSLSAGDLACFSSRGPTVDGRVKPDITAPGHRVTSTLSQDVDQFALDDVSSDGMHWTISGTSMATPVATGATALLLQQRPNLNIDQIRSLLLNTTSRDAQTGTVPNNDWGTGKLDILAAMQASTPAASALNSPPRFVTALPDTTIESAPNVLAFQFAGTDPEGQSLTFRSPDLPAGATLDASTGLLRWQPAATDVGTWIVGFWASDGVMSATHTAAITVQAAANLAPAFTSVLSDTTVAPFSEVSVTYRWVDPNLDSLSLTTPELPTSATVFERFDGGAADLLWFPDDSEIGEHRITLTVSDGQEAVSTTAVVTVEAATGGAPVFTALMPDTTVTAGTTLGFQYEAGDGSGFSPFFVVDDAPLNATLSESGAFAWTPDESEVGTHTVAVTALGTFGATSTESIVTVVSGINAAPTFASALPDTTINTGSTLTFAYTATDINRDPLTFTLTTGPAGSTLSSSGAFSWTPTGNQVGSHTVSAQVSDGNLSDAHSSTITVVSGVNIDHMEIPHRFSFQGAFPNPAGDQLDFAFDIPAAETIRLLVFDSLGRAVHNQSSQLPAGRHRLPLDASGLAGGLYHFVLATSTDRIGGQFVRLR